MKNYALFVSIVLLMYNSSHSRLISTHALILSVSTALILGHQYLYFLI